jgi:hypothetical protein
LGDDDRHTGLRRFIQREREPSYPQIGDERRVRCVAVRCGQFWTVMLTPGLNALPDALLASDTRTYEPLGTVLVFQAHNHP